MTETARCLRRLGLPHTRARVTATVLGSVGVALAIAAAGLWLAPWSAGVAAAWLAIIAVAGMAARAARHAGRALEPRVLGRMLEGASETRAGSVVGTIEPVGGPSGHAVSAELFALADARAARAVTAAAPQVRRILARGTRRRLVAGTVAAAGGAALFIAASPAAGRAAFWHPLRAFADARAPVRLEVDRASARRGDTVTVTIEARAATAAILWTRGPGEPWRSIPVALDSAGRTVQQVGPLEADLYLRATSGGRRSDDRKIAVALPAFLAALDVTARFPAYLERADESVLPGPDTILVPVGTEIVTGGAASVALGSAAWIGRARASGVGLAVAGSQFSGRFKPIASGTWQLVLAPAEGGPLEGDAPALHLRVVPDSAPTVSVPVPGRDTILPVTLRQPLVIDARDDHGVTRVDIVSWRVSQTGKVGDALRRSIDVSGAGDRALLQGALDAEGRGLLPGDTLRFRVEAWDNAPVAHRGQSAEIALRLASLAELRAATRAATHDVGATADSLAGAAADLSRRMAELAQERPREGSAAGERAAGAQAGSLPFEVSERATAIADQVAELQERARQLAQAVERVARVAQQAGLNDTAFQARLEEVRQLLQQALTPELEQRLRDLQTALERLNPDATRQALEQLAESQRRFREALERSRSLFQRAAVEGALESLAADAEDLQRRQGEWNRAFPARPDSAAGRRERALAVRADSLARAIARMGGDLARTGSARSGAPLATPQAAAVRAMGAMQGAAAAADANDAARAMRDGAVAESALAEIPDELRAQRDSAVRAWRQETLDALDRALSESAALAERQLQIAEGLRAGEAGAATRSRQASVEEGTQVIGRQIRAASGRHALVSPELEGALALARHQMRAARQQLEASIPNPDAAAALAEASVDALNATAYALARTRSDVANAKSGSGFAEAMERLTKLAGQQGALNAQAQGLLPLGVGAGDAVQEQLRALAAQQRALADQLDRLRAEGASTAAGALGQEARDLARQLEAGRLDSQTVRRQERLYHRLLDAGRTLTSASPDEQRARVSRPATDGDVHTPALLAPGATGSGPPLRYPTWDELMALTPEQRRLVLEYFRRVNAPPVAH